MAKVGVVPALINSNLAGQPLVHSINAASAVAVVYGTELAQSEYNSFFLKILQVDFCSLFNQFVCVLVQCARLL